MSTAAFATRSFDSLVVGTVRVVVHNLGPVKPGANISYNHWTISLLVAPNKQVLESVGPRNSVRLDLQPKGPQNGELSIELHDYLVTRSAITYFDFNIVPERTVTVAIIKNTLQTKGRHKYTMTKHGGCQWWCWNVVNDLVGLGFLSSTAATQLETVLKNNYSVTLSPFPHNIELGTFY